MSAIPQKIRAVLDLLEQDPESPPAFGDYRVAADGSVVPHGPGPLRFAFTCFGIRVSAELDRSNGRPHLAFDALLGRVPYTAESRQARERVLAAIRSGRGRMLATDGREIRARDSLDLPGPLTPVAVIGAAGEFMLRLASEIEATDAVGGPVRTASRVAA